MSYDFSPINPQQMRQLQLQEAHNPLASHDKFASVMDKVNLGVNMFGPTATSGMEFGGLGKGAQITSAALYGTPMSGSYGSTSGKFMSWGDNPGISKQLGGMPATAPGYPGSSGVGGAGMSGYQDSSAFNSQIDSMMNNNMLFLAMQTKVQQVSQTTQMMSNIAKTDWDSKMAAVRNMRA